MKMNSFALKASVAAVAAAFAGSAAAIVTLDITPTGAKVFASDLNYVTATPLVGAVGDLSVATKLGFGVSSGATRYIRLSLTNAVYGGTAGALTAPDAGTIVQGGAAGDNYVIYQFTAGANRDATAAVAIANPASIRVTSTASPVGITYRLHETAVDAVNGTNGLSTVTANLVTFIAGLKYSVVPGSATAIVAQGFKKFTANTSTKTLGVIDYGVSAALDRAGGGITLSQLTTTATNVVVTGDFGAAVDASSIFLGTLADGSCAVGTAGVMNSAKNSSVITLSNTVALNRDICYTVNGTVIIPSQTVNQALDVTTIGGSSVVDTTAAALGTIIRDGAQTIALNITDPANVDLTFIRISNMGTSTGKVTGTLYDQTGVVLGTASATLIAAFAPKVTSVFSASQLATIFGVTAWTGRAKLEIIAEIPAADLRVQNLIRTNNTLTNMGGDTSGNRN